MKKVLMFTLIILGATTFMMQDAMAKPDKAPKTPKFNAVSRLAHAGDIHGNVSCFEDVDVSDANYVFVFIPGTSFIAIPDTTTGDFTIYNVPAGAYDVQIVAADTGPSPSPGATMPVNVVGKTISELCTTEP